MLDIVNGLLSTMVNSKTIHCSTGGYPHKTNQEVENSPFRPGLFIKDVIFGTQVSLPECIFLTAV